MNWLPDGPVTVGLTAGASTPNNIVGQVVARLEALAGRDRDAATHLAESKALAQQCGMDWPTLESACEVALGAAASPRGHRLAREDHA